MEIIDLSQQINENTIVYPGTKPPSFTKLFTLANEGYIETAINISSHLGTHVDAPAHMLKNSPYLDEIPIERFIGKAFVIDVSGISSRFITQEFLLQYQDNIADCEFLILNTGHCKFWNSPDYFSDYPLLTINTAKWLTSFNLKGIGIDTISVDSMMSKTFKIHRTFMENNMLIIENLTNLNKLYNRHFTFSCLPIKYKYAEASPVRAIAIF